MVTHEPPLQAGREDQYRRLSHDERQALLDGDNFVRYEKRAGDARLIPVVELTRI
jgi:hypothetical protein